VSPLLRIWGIGALAIALLALLRGAFALALALFLFSPAPVLLFAHGAADPRRLSLSWLVVLVALVAALCMLFLLIVYAGGIPPMHEWSAVLRARAAG
jgi:hypothetical protein